MAGAARSLGFVRFTRGDKFPGTGGKGRAMASILGGKNALNRERNDVLSKPDSQQKLEKAVKRQQNGQLSAKTGQPRQQDASHSKKICNFARKTTRFFPSFYRVFSLRINSLP
jgi:hypothetical protein